VTLQFRPANAEDGRQLLSLHTRAIRKLGKDQYSEKELISWAYGLSAEGYGLQMREEAYEVAQLPQGTIVGFCATKANVLRGLFVDPDHARRGIGSQLLARHPHLTHLTASLPAVEFYKHHGWVEVRRWKEMSRGGLMMWAVDMERHLL